MSWKKSLFSFYSTLQPVLPLHSTTPCQWDTLFPTAQPRPGCRSWQDTTEDSGTIKRIISLKMATDGAVDGSSQCRGPDPVSGSGLPPHPSISPPLKTPQVCLCFSGLQVLTVIRPRREKSSPKSPVYVPTSCMTISLFRRLLREGMSITYAINLPPFPWCPMALRKQLQQNISTGELAWGEHLVEDANSQARRSSSDKLSSHPLNCSIPTPKNFAASES